MSNRGERTYQAGSEQPNVGTDPMETPQQDEKKKQVAPDPKKAKEAEQRSDQDDTPEDHDENNKGS